MNPDEWRLHMRHEHHISTQGKHYLDLALQAGEADIVLLDEPYQTFARRVNAGKFLYDEESFKALPLQIRKPIFRCWEAWKQAVEDEAQGRAARHQSAQMADLMSVYGELKEI